MATVLCSTARSVRTGPLDGMRAMTSLRPADLRDGADRAERDAAGRRAVARAMKRDGITSLTPGEVKAHPAYIKETV